MAGKIEIDSNLVGRRVVKKYDHLWDWKEETASAEIVAIWLDSDRNPMVMLVNDAGETKKGWLDHYNILKDPTPFTPPADLHF